MKEEAVAVTSEYGEKLEGLFAQPLEPKPHNPAVLLVHGFGEDKHEFPSGGDGMFDQLTRLMAACGFAVARFSSSGRGESEGNYHDTSLSKQRSELNSMLAWVKEAPKVDATKVAVVAQSFGTCAAVDLAPQVRAMVLMGTIADPHAVMQRLFGNGYNPMGTSVLTYDNGTSIEVGPQFFDDFRAHDLLVSIKRIHCPVLFMHGGADTVVSLSQMQAMYAAANEPKEQFILGGGDHGLQPGRDKAFKHAAGWLIKQLG